MYIFWSIIFIIMGLFQEQIFGTFDVTRETGLFLTAWIWLVGHYIVRDITNQLVNKDEQS